MDGDPVVNTNPDNGHCPHDELAVGLALHSLEPDEEQTARDHVADCLLCQETVRSTEKILALVGSSVDQHEPPTGLRTRLLDVVGRTPQAVPAPGFAEAAPAAPTSVPAPVSLDARRRRSRTGRVLLAAAAVVVLVLGGVTAVLGVQLGRLNSQQEAQAAEQAKVHSIITDPSVRQAVLADSDGKPAAMLLSSRSGTALVPMGLRPNDADQIYALWGLKSGVPVPLVPFDVSSAGTVVEALDVPAAIAGLTQFAISREPGRTMPAKPTTVLATGAVA